MVVTEGGGITVTEILLISGSTRDGSTNTAALRTAQEAAPEGVDAVLYDGLDLVVAALRARIKNADAVLICTPEYAGALPGSFKNLLDWTVGGDQMYRKPTAWINVAAEGRGTLAHASLATVLGYINAAVIEKACQNIPVARDAVSDGVVTDPDVRAQIVDVLTVIRDSVTAV
jgi:chromate reductase